MDAPLSLLLYRLGLYPHHPTLANFTVATVGDERWICLQGDGSRIPTAAAARRFAAPTSGTTSGAASLLDVCEAIDAPVWAEPGRFHRGYIPDGGAVHDAAVGEATPWVYAPFHDVRPYTNGATPPRIKRSVIKTIRADMERADSLIRVLNCRHGLPVIATSWPTNWLTLYVAQGEIVVRAVLESFRSIMLDLLGALSCLLNLASPTERQLVLLHETDVALVNEWRIFTGPKVGLMLDLRAIDRAPFPLFRLLRHGVPIYIPWGGRYRVRPTFDARLGHCPIVDGSTFSDLIEQRCQENVARSPVTPFRPRPPPAVPSEQLWIELRGQVEAVIKSAFPGDTAPAFASTGKVWSRTVLEHARLLVSPLAEAKLRAYVLRYRTTSVEELLTVAFECGIEFALTYHDDFIGQLRANLPELTSAEQYNIGWQPYYEDGYADYVLPYCDHGDRVWYLQFEQRARDLLRRPHTTAFLTMDPLVSRIAREYGPPDLADRYMAGPSSSFVRFGRSLASDAGYSSDGVSYDELNVLLGVTRDRDGATARSWWPHPNLLRDCGFDLGEWTEEHERWFRDRLEGVWTDGYATPLTAQEWTVQLAARAVRFRARYEVPTTDDVERLQEGLEATLGSWASDELPLLRLYAE
ncbi:hypothetical protein PsYK624_168520 [Phanerochaete sordida]|uniref:Uncharacterized protein n=1 Tax=Phanerochaete sordida TaxID=48140 RepID=A0A9P3LM85_9APHY|nr:hypothetical protein PsYK624_168520 [Phanerochaete sordida]